jgi:hypothetical protein
MIERAGSVLDTEQKAELRNLVFEFLDIWRVALSLEMDQQKRRRSKCIENMMR